MLDYLIGHRGASGYEDENTIRSFRRAFKDGANAVELDLRLTSDRALVIMHDPTVTRTTNGVGEVANMTFEELRTLDAGKGESVPTLTECLRLAKRFGGTVFAEIKAPGMQNEIIHCLSEGEAAGSVVVFGLRAEIALLHQVDPSIPCTYPGIFRIGLSRLSRRDVSQMHMEGLKLIHGDIDDEAEMERLIRTGLDGIITNFPNRLARVTKRLQNGG